MNNFEKLMQRWESALDAYSTPRDFADRTLIHLLENPRNKEDIALRITIAPGFAMRGELMEKQKEESERRRKGNIPQRWSGDGCSCFLCDNVGQARDIGNNLILPYGEFKDFVVVPNRYPKIRGHFLLCAKEHDSAMSVTEDYLDMIVRFAETYDASVFRNHPRTGMSIPEHEHCQAQPKIVTIDSGKRVPYNGLTECSFVPAEFEDGIFHLTKTRFDSLAFNGKGSIDKLSRIIKNLDNGCQMYTFQYDPEGSGKHQGTFYLTVHSKGEKGVGAGMPLYCGCVLQSGAMPEYEGYIKEIEHYLYRNGDFDWRPFFS